MNIKGSTVVVLGGGGMVGRAVCRELIEREPARIVVCGLFEEEAQEAVASLQEEYERTRVLHTIKNIEFVTEWGNIFVRDSLRHMTTGQIIASPQGRQAIIEDTLAPLTFETLERFYIYRLIMKHRPDVIIDGVNTATTIAYSDIFSRARRVWTEVADHGTAAQESLENLLCSLYIPQLIRHVDVLYRSMARANTQAYVKLGTSGTGGMGWNIPYTHGEERPSPLLLSKSAVAGAHTLLLFLLARTPGIVTFQEDDPQTLVSKRAPSTMEIKPTAMIGWRSLAYGEVKKKGRPVRLEEVSLDDAVALGEQQELVLHDPERTRLSERVLETVFVDTGENGMFSTEEFVAITSPGQMEFVTPEEIARNVVDEVSGVNTGKDVINALNVTCMGPTYRAGFQRERAIKKLRQLEAEHHCESVAFENLGPPRLSKLLFEAALLRRIYATIQAAAEADPQEMSRACLGALRMDSSLVATPVTLGIPIVFEQDGALRLIRGRDVKTPPLRDRNTVPLTGSSVEQWTRAGWIDLRQANMATWKQRLHKVVADAGSIPSSETSSRYVRDYDFWGEPNDRNWPINPGELVAWIFINEDKGERGRE